MVNSYLESKMSECPHSFENFFQIFQNTVQLFAPLKKKYIRHENKTFMSKSLRKATMTHSKLRNEHNKNMTQENWINFEKERNDCVKILRNLKKEYLSNLNLRKCYR